MDHAARPLPSWSFRSIRSSQSLHICSCPACHNGEAKRTYTLNRTRRIWHLPRTKPHVSLMESTPTRPETYPPPAKPRRCMPPRRESRPSARRLRGTWAASRVPRATRDRRRQSPPGVRHGGARSRRVRKKSAAMPASGAPAVPVVRAFARRRREDLLTVRVPELVAGPAEAHLGNRRRLSALP